MRRDVGQDCLVEGGRVLVHCKMGISRSASTVIAFAMKYYQWNMGEQSAFTPSSNEKTSVADPDPSDPYVFGPPGSGSIRQSMDPEPNPSINKRK